MENANKLKDTTIKAFNNKKTEISYNPCTTTTKEFVFHSTKTSQTNSFTLIYSLIIYSYQKS